MAANGCRGDLPPEFNPQHGVVHPLFGATTTQAVAPPAISGGTLIISREAFAVAADPDRDSIYIVDLKTRAVTTLAMQPGDEPGRLVEDDAGRVHVVLRSGHAIVDIDVASKTVLGRRDVCVEPRGIDFDETDASLYVACASGQLVQLPAAGGASLRSIQLGRDLRDVVVDTDSVLVTRFRTAETLAVSKHDWSLGNTWLPLPSSDDRTPSIAWRASLVTRNQRMMMLHQRGPGAAAPPVEITEGGYASSSTPIEEEDPCPHAIVETAITQSMGDQGDIVGTTSALVGAVVPVDFAPSPDGKVVAVASAGNAFTPGAQSVLVYATDNLTNSPECIHAKVTPQPPGQATAVAFTTDSKLVVQTREPAALFLPDSGVTIRLSDISRDDTGHDVFHANSGGELACASCHPEGADDGRVWNFDPIGPRRTPSLRGTVAQTAPYHWSGDMADFSQLAHDVFSERMSGPELAPEQVGALTNWVSRLPAPVAPPADDADAVTRGKKLYEGKAACTKCHGGAMLTNNESVDIRKGGEKFQAPSLVGVGYRAPFLHDGCAATLKDRFTNLNCGGIDHGDLSSLAESDVDDLVAYLETL